MNLVQLMHHEHWRFFNELTLVLVNEHFVDPRKTWRQVDVVLALCDLLLNCLCWLSPFNISNHPLFKLLSGRWSQKDVVTVKEPARSDVHGVCETALDKCDFSTLWDWTYIVFQYSTAFSGLVNWFSFSLWPTKSEHSREKFRHPTVVLRNRLRILNQVLNE